MIVERINIPLNEIVDDSAYNIRTKEQNAKRMMNDRFIRLRLLKKVDNPKLHLRLLTFYRVKIKYAIKFESIWRIIKIYRRTDEIILKIKIIQKECINTTKFKVILVHSFIYLPIGEHILHSLR